MELIVVFAGFLVVIVILLFLSALHYFLVRTTDPSSSDAVNTLTQRTTSQRARKRARRQTKRSQQQQQQPKHDEQTNGQDDQSLDNKTDDDDDESVSPPVEQPHEETSADNDDEFEDIIDLEPSSPSMSSEFSNVTRVIDEETPPTALKQRAKQKPPQTNGKQSSNVLKNESIVPLKPQASVAPVKQVERSKSKDSSKPSINADPADALKSKPNSSSTVYSPSQQRIRSEDPTNSSKTSSSKKKSKKTPMQPESSSSPTIQHDQTNSRSGQRMNKDTPSHSSELPESSINNDYSSESDFVTEPVAPTKYSTNHHSYPSKTFDRLSHHSKLVESHSSPCHPVDRLVSALDADTFTTDQLELLLSKVISKHCFHPADRQDLLTTRKNEIMLERLIDENNRNHVKMLAMELQSEKNRVSDLSQTNAELEQRLRELQHYSQQQYVPPESLLRYQQAINSYQLQLKRITDENNQLMHQLHAYSMIPASINELKQQNQIVEEQIRQMSLRNSILEKEIADGERASKNAADIYRKCEYFSISSRGSDLMPFLF